VSGLLYPGLLFEIEGIAVSPGAARTA
jgi:hypothetical protein